MICKDHGEEYYNKIVEYFGRDILKENEEIDRKSLAKIVFSNKNKKTQIDKLTLNYVIPEIEKKAKDISKEYIAVIDAALLIELGLDKICDITIGVLAKKESCISRICKRDGIDIDRAIIRLNIQNDEIFFKINCDYCIRNDNNVDFKFQLEKILNGENLSNKEIIHLCDSGLEYLQFRKLLKYSNNITHCYTLKPLDFRIGDKEAVLDNYSKLCSTLELDEKDIYRPHQTHSSNIKVVDDEMPGIHSNEFENVDGLITNKENKILSLVFADCICLYFYDPIKNVIGNIHSGWRGTYNEIAKLAIDEMKREYEVNPENLICRYCTEY